MAETPPEPRKRRPNPKCDSCSHPFTFHRRDPVSHRRKCSAFGCKCKNFVQPKEAAA